MKGAVKIGTVGEERFVVSEQHLIDFAHDGMPQILCTPQVVCRARVIYSDGPLSAT